MAYLHVRYTDAVGVRQYSHLYLENDTSVRTSQRTESAFFGKTGLYMLYREIIAVCSEIHTKHINTLCGQNVELVNVKRVVHIVTTGL